MIISEYIPKRKKKKPNAKTRELKASWEALLKKYDSKTEVRKSPKLGPSINYTAILRDKRSSSHIPSLDTGVGVATKPIDKVYTGDAIIGISVMHKSNSIPVFNTELIQDISKMRR